MNTVGKSAAFERHNITSAKWHWLPCPKQQFRVDTMYFVPLYSAGLSGGA